VGPGNRVLLLDALSHMRRDFEAGRLEMHLGAVDANVLAGFVAGYRACLGDNGVGDPEYAAFSEWLRAEKGEFPPEGWAEKYLREFQGDHRAAIRKFLNFVAEFRASNAR